MTTNILVLLGFTMLLVSCASGPKMTPAQIKKMDERMARASLQMDRRSP